jgi:hypothetical protein
MDNTRLTLIFMKFMQAHRGRENAIQRDRVLDHMQLWEPKMTDRQLRDLYSKQPVCSCDQGLFIPIRPAEVEDFKKYLEAKAIPLLSRYKTVLAYYPHLAPVRGEQQELFGN